MAGQLKKTLFAASLIIVSFDSKLRGFMCLSPYSICRPFLFYLDFDFVFLYLPNISYSTWVDPQGLLDDRPQVGALLLRVGNELNIHEAAEGKLNATKVKGALIRRIDSSDVNPLLPSHVCI